MITNCNFHQENNNLISNFNISDRNIEEIIKTLCSDKIRLLEEKKELCQKLEEKDKEIIDLTNNFKVRWDKIINYIKTVETILKELNCEDKRINYVKQTLLEHYDDSSVNDALSRTNSSSITTETGESNYTSSSGSIKPDVNDGTMTKNTPEANHTQEFQSLSSLSAYKSLESSHYNQSDSTDRPHSHCVQSYDNTIQKSLGKLDSAISEPEFRVPEAPSPGISKLFKRTSALKKEKGVKLYYYDYNGNDVTQYSFDQTLQWLTDTVKLPKSLLENIKRRQVINGQTLAQLTDQRFEKIFGTNDKLIRRKLFVCLEDCQNYASGTMTQYELDQKDSQWVCNVWLKKHLGLSHLISGFQSRNIDGRMLRYLAEQQQEAPNKQKELIALAITNFDKNSGLVSPMNINTNNNGLTTSTTNNANGEASKFELRSIRFGLQFLSRFNFDTNEIEIRRNGCENNNNDLLVWTNERLAKWFLQVNQKNCIRGIEYSGLHGAVMVLDANFSMTQMWKLLQIPNEVIHKHYLDDKFSSLLKPCRFNEGVKSRRSNTIFRRRSFSQPRQPKMNSSKSMNIKSVSTSSNNPQKISSNDQSQYSKTLHHEKSHTLDLSKSNTSKIKENTYLNNNNNNNNNNINTYQQPNFIRNYRRPDPGGANKLTLSYDPQFDKSSNSSLNTTSTGYLYTKSPPPPKSSHSNQITRTKKSKSSNQSDEENKGV